MRFDGVYMNADFWINGHPLGNHPYGYTSFEFDLTPYLKPAGQENVLAVRVRNEGKNSRWYSGSGIYRHTWLTVTEPDSRADLGRVCDHAGNFKGQSRRENHDRSSQCQQGAKRTWSSARECWMPKAKSLKTTESKLHLPANETRPVEQTLEVRSPKLWSPDSPELYSAEVEIVAARQNGGHGFHAFWNSQN